MNQKPLVISILAKSNEVMLPLYLDSMLAQTAISDNTIFYIRTNDNRDNTAEILHDWYKKWNHKWKMYFDDSSVYPKLVEMENHDWEGDFTRFKILGQIRKNSVDFADSENADYFVADIDNIVQPDTIESIRSLNLPVVAPLLRTPEWGPYSNFHADVDERGYYKASDMYMPILNRSIIGVFLVPVVHCTYFIQREYLKDVVYDDNSWRYEYVVFSDNLRKKGIPQFIDNRKCYGVITFSSTQEHLEGNRTYESFTSLEEYIQKTLNENGIQKI
jgi:hypothetical protein